GAWVLRPARRFRAGAGRGRVALLAFRPPRAALPALPGGGGAPATSIGLTGVDAVNLASLVEIVTGGSVDTEEASPELESPVLSAGASGPSIHLLPDDATRPVGDSASAPRPHQVCGPTRAPPTPPP